MVVKLKSGRELHANRGIFGLDSSLTLTEGYDGNLYFSEDEGDYTPLTKEEKQEIADIIESEPEGLFVKPYVQS